MKEEEEKKESKGTEYYKGYAEGYREGYRDAMKDVEYILKPYMLPYVPMKNPTEWKEWWESPPMWNTPITTTSATKWNFSEAQQTN